MFSFLKISPGILKLFYLLTIDFLIVGTSILISFILRLGDFPILNSGFFITFFWALFLTYPILFFSGVYRLILRYAENKVFISLLPYFIIYLLIFSLIVGVIGINFVPRTIGIIQPFVMFLLIGFSRVAIKLVLNIKKSNKNLSSKKSNILIYGAGQAGQNVARALGAANRLRIIGYLDDDSTLHNRHVSGLFVYDPNRLPELINKLEVSDILIAIPSASRQLRNRILKKISAYHISVHTMPSLNDLALGKCDISDIKDLDIEDILGRQSIDPDIKLLEQNICEKVVAVTGAGGSIGSELCRQILIIKPKQLLLIDQSEFGLYQIKQDLQSLIAANGLKTALFPLLMSVRDTQKLSEVLNAFKPDTIYHAAAYKHVPIVERNPIEGIQNNVFGTINLANLAIEYGVKNFVLISTDKAVRPTNIMGTSKRISEMYLQAKAVEQHHTKFCMVRFGNVLDSSGSVVPKFRKQIETGGPVTLTDPRVTRYFMTIPEAAQLVIQAGAMSQVGGEVFLLDMGEPVKIQDLAIRMIELSGLTVKSNLNPDGDIEIINVGLRPGEKLYEELLIGENAQPTSHPKIMMALEKFTPYACLAKELDLLSMLISSNDLTRIYEQLKKIVPEFAPSDGISDLIYLIKNN